MSEADGVDSGAICKRGFIHLQFAEKPEAPEAERHVVKSRATVSPWVSRSSNLHAVGPGSEVLVICRNLIGCKYHLANGCVLYDFSKIFSIQFQLNIERHANTGKIGRTLTPVSAGRDVGFSGANKSPTDMDYV
ncbi:hypothetical protein V1477_009498 [Vespula maculifrons]|uniref:Uncharacterized protein n=1 Tax=Vespula maculifrons TaxID=7453 RepID=A0ABD2CAT9_VESMC